MHNERRGLVEGMLISKSLEGSDGDSPGYGKREGRAGKEKEEVQLIIDASRDGLAEDGDEFRTARDGHSDEFNSASATWARLSRAKSRFLRVASAQRVNRLGVGHLSWAAKRS